MIIAGFVGYFLNKNKYPIAPLLLAFVLTYDLEKYLSQSFRINGGSASIFVKKPIALAFLIVMVLMMIVPVIMKKVKAKKAAASKPEE